MQYFELLSFVLLIFTSYNKTNKLKSNIKILTLSYLNIIFSTFTFAISLILNPNLVSNLYLILALNFFIYILKNFLKITKYYINFVFKVQDKV